jgi:hypothetical protein
MMMSAYLAHKTDPSVRPEQAAAAAFQSIQANGFEYSGRYAWTGGGRDQQPVSRMLGMEPSVFEENFAPVIDRKLEAAGITVSNKTSVSITRTGDLLTRDEEGNITKRTPQLTVMAMNKNGQMVTVRIDGTMIREVQLEAARKEAERREAFEANRLYMAPRGNMK